METKPNAPVRKQNCSARLFLQAITYRIQRPVTKGIVYADDTAYPICPRCTLSLDREYMAYCDRCGRKLCWKRFAHTKVVRPGLKRK